MSERGRWVKGQSGNSSGRPPSERALAQVLRVTGEHDSYGEISNKMLLARMVWEGLIWGKITFAGDKTVDLTAKEWLEMLRWLHSHIDGAYQPDAPEAEARKFKPPQYVYGPEELMRLFDKRLAECDGDIMRLWHEEGADVVEPDGEGS